jgi:NAD(P)H-flavin reductase
MSKLNGNNALLPYIGEIVEEKDLAPEIKLLGIEMKNGSGEYFQNYKPGQFAFISAFGKGEAPFGIASTPHRGNVLEFAVQRLGSVTTALHELSKGDLVGVRGPLGNSFPMDDFEGKDILVIGGGIGAAPLRPVIHSVIDNRKKFGKLTILLAARHPALHVFQDEYHIWQEIPNTNLQLTVDEPDENWGDHVGLITDLIRKISPSPKNTIAIICGPPVMIYYTNQLLDEIGFHEKQQFVTLEARMHCGIGKCGRCNIDKNLICVDGPVFSMKEVNAFSESYL